MKGEIDRDFYCAFATHGECRRFEKEQCPRLCTYCRRKWPTPEQFKEMYGEEYPDGGAVYEATEAGLSAGLWSINSYEGAKIAKAFNPKAKRFIACACTPWGCPPADWRQE